MSTPALALGVWLGLHGACLIAIAASNACQALSTGSGTATLST
jgi:hypothetical protein